MPPRDLRWDAGTERIRWTSVHAFHGDPDTVAWPEAVTLRNIDIEPECLSAGLVLGHQAFPPRACPGNEINGGGDLQGRFHKKGSGGGIQTAREVTSQVVLLE